MLQTKLEEQVQDNFSNYDNIETMLSEMKTDREDVNEGKPPAVFEPVDESSELETTRSPEAQVTDVIDVHPHKIPALIAKGESIFIARMHDRVQAFICSVIAMEDNPDQFKADSEELQEIADYIYAWRKDSIKPLPDWIMILIAIVLIYGPKYKFAMSIRKEKKLLIVQQNEIQSLQQQNESLLELIRKFEADKNNSPDDGKKED